MNTDEILKKMEKYRLPSIKIKLRRADDNLSIFTSKFGGYPYIPKNSEYPRGENMDLVFIAQINCEELPLNEIYPKKGLLQFFIGGDDLFGLGDFTNLTDNKNFKVIYHETIDKNVTLEEVKEKYKLREYDDDYYGIFENYNDCYTLGFKKEMQFPSVSDFRYEKIMSKITENKKLSDSVEDELWDELESDGSRIGGYATFTQSDPRELKEYSDYKIMLLQIDSEADDDGNWQILWGDCGVGNFFITKEQLEKLDFSKVLFNWDCC